MKVDEAIEVARASIDDHVHWRQIQIDALRSLADEVKRLREQPRPRSMESASRGKMLLLVLKDGTAEGRWRRGVPSGVEGWSVRGEWVTPLGWWPIPTATVEQIAELTTTDEQVGE